MAVGIGVKVGPPPRKSTAVAPIEPATGLTIRGTAVTVRGQTITIRGQ